MTIEFTHEQAAQLRVGTMAGTTPSDELSIEGLVLDCGHGDYSTTDAGREALAAYDADQVSKRAAEIEAAFREGFNCASGRLDSESWIEESWMESDAKKSLETK